MPLTRKRLTIPLAGGLNTAEDPKVQQRGSLICENALVEVEHEIRKRHGTEVLSGSHNEKYLTSYKDRPYLYDDESVGSLKAYDGSDQENGGFSAASEVYLSDVDVTPHISAHRVDNVCSAQADDVRLVVYQEVYTTDTAYGTQLIRGCVRTFNWRTGELLDSLDIAGSPDMRCIFTGNKLRYFYVDSSTGVIYYGEVSSTTGAISSATALNSGAQLCNQSYNFDLCAVNDADHTTVLAMCHPTSGDVRVYALEDDGTEHDSGAIAATTAVRVGCFKHVTGVAAVCWHDNGLTPNQVLCGFYDDDATQTVAPVSVWSDPGGFDVYGISGAYLSASSVQIYMTVHRGLLTGQHTYHIDTNSCDTSTGAGTSALFAEGAVLAAHCIPLDGTSHYVPCICEKAGNDQRTYLVVQRTGVPVAKALVGRAVHPINTVYNGATGGCVLAPADGSATVWRHGLPRRASEAVVGAATVEWTITTTTTPNAWETDKHLVFGGALPQVFDGQRVMELGFLWYPFEINCAAGGAGTSPAATVRYRAIYEAYDALGGRWVSRASPEVLWTKAVNTDVRITIPTLGITRWLDVRIVLYRTVDNGNTFYRLMDVANDEDAASVSIDDDYSTTDAALVSNERLYQQAEYPNLQTWAFRAACVHEGRLFYVPVERPTEIWYTKPFRRDRGVEDPARFRIKVNPEGGDILALRSFGGRLLAFKRHHILYTYGDGYSPNGAGANFQDPQLITRVGGCVDQRTIVELGERLGFLGADGLAGLNAKFRYEPNFGEDVRYLTDVDGLAPTRGVLIPDLGLAVWSEDGSATWLVYDIHRRRWMTWRSYQASDAVVASAGYLYTKVHSSADCYVEDRDNHEDGGSGGSAYTFKVRTPWINVADLAGFARLWKLYIAGQLMGACKLVVKVAYDFVPHFLDTIELLLDSADVVEPDEHYKTGVADTFLDKQLLVKCAPSRQKCTAIMVQIEDAAYGAVALNNSFTLTGLVLDYGVKKGLRPVGTTRIGT